MKLYILNVKGKIDYDTCYSRVVRAKDEQKARQLANESCGGEGKVWENPDVVDCEVISRSGDPEVILSAWKDG